MLLFVTSKGCKSVYRVQTFRMKRFTQNVLRSTLLHPNEVTKRSIQFLNATGHLNVDTPKQLQKV